MVVAEAIRPIVRECGPTAAVDVLRLLGWSSNRAHIDHLVGSPNEYARLILGSGLTGAGTQSAAEEDLWWTGFQQGARYHLAVVDRSVRWYDFHARQEWQAGSEDDLRPLLSLGPEQFVETGTFTPGANLNKSQRLPGKPPREYLTDLVKEWYTRFLKWDESSRNKDPGLVQQDFVNLVARLVFIRTIEDLGSCEWLPANTLMNLADSKNTSQRLADLFQHLKGKVNSQVFSNVGEALPQQDAITAELLRAMYGSRDRLLNFAAIEFSMIGRFYERVLGDHHEVRDTSQLALYGPQERTVTPISHRRELGQYYTPPVYAEYLARKVVLPRVRAAKDVSQLPRVADIAVGSGEMLTASLHAMLSVPRFRTPDNVRYILQNKLVGIDINPTATQLTALNLIRTALLLCPELLQGEPVFPTVEGLHVSNALRQRAFTNLGQIDVILTNPPFRGQPDWKDDSKPRGLMNSLSGQSNKATAFLLRATQFVAKEGTIGIVMPNQFFSSKGNRSARKKLLDCLNIMEIVDNQGARIFDGVNNQPGMLIARANPSIRTPNMVLTCLAPSSSQARAILSTGLDSSPGARRQVTPLPRPEDKSWLGETRTKLATAKQSDASIPTVPVSALLAHKLIRAPIASVGPIGEVWAITRSNGQFFHKFTGKKFSIYETKFIRPAFSPKQASRISTEPLKIPPCDDWTIFPYIAQADGSYTPVQLTEWRKLDARLHGLMLRICEGAKRLPFKNSDHEKYRQDLEKGLPQYYRLNSLRTDTSLLVMSRMAKIQAGSESWSAWAIPSDKSIVPLSGLFAQSTDLRLLEIIACLLNTSKVFEQLREVGSARSAGWVEVSPSLANALLIPDIRDSRLGPKLTALRSALSSSSRSKADLSHLAEQMWLP